MNMQCKGYMFKKKIKNDPSLDILCRVRSVTELAMAQAEFSRSMADMDYSQVGLPRFHVQDEIRSPSQETIVTPQKPVVR